jgi:hypothetical protein
MFLVAPAFLLSVFWIAALTTVVLLLVAVWETWALRAWRARLAGEEAH